MPDPEAQVASRIVIEFVAPGSALFAVKAEGITPGQWPVAEAIMHAYAAMYLPQVIAQSTAPSIVRAVVGAVGDLRRT